MPRRPLVSVIIPTYNRAQLLREAISSVLAQTCQDFEILVADDGSSDNTGQAVAAIADPRIVYIPLARSGRPAVPRNAAMARARGRYLAFLDSDDLWLPGKLALQTQAMAARPGLLAVAANVGILPGGPEKAQDRSGDELVSFDALAGMQTWLANSTVLLDAAVPELIGPLDEDPALRGTEDHDYWLRILRHRDVSILNMAEVLAGYRLHGDNLLGALMGEKTLRMLARIYRKHLDFRPGLLGGRLEQIEAELSLTGKTSGGGA
ncbi:MAG: glycosyltransferase family 2 protein [Desulfovibrionaceae bacterium]|nr:glycosyltransferase family 2 protein [Desulfovibrionaceae bacterium]MBF0512680.1 glycosyltransferase family 2 protein [Desulfovibrionaceae bacterium]